MQTIRLRQALLATLMVFSNGAPVWAAGKHTGSEKPPVSIDLSNYTLVLNDGFDTSLNAYDGKTGVWDTGPRRDVLVTNSPQSVFVSDNTQTSDGKGVGLNPFTVKDGVLSISSGIIPDANIGAVKDALHLAGQDQYVNQTKYYTGMISTSDTWGQTYGYFEMRGQIPEGKGHWPAFWLASAGIGWPPEIDVFEAYGRGVAGKTGSDNQFNSAVFFDSIDAQGKDGQAVLTTNPYDLDAHGNPTEATVKDKNGATQYEFHERTDAMKEFGADIYKGMWTWGCQWTPKDIIFYFGPDHDHMVEVFRTPTPADATSPMYLIANDQIGSTFGWNPVTGADDKTFASNNTFNIDYIKMYALNPTNVVKAVGIGATVVEGNGDSHITDSIGNDKIAVGDGQDMIDLQGGADTIFVQKGQGNKIISGFGHDDKIVLEGFFFDGAHDALSRLTQVGNDVWLINGADPANPQTIDFKNTKVSDFSESNFVVRWSVTKDIWSSAIHDESRMTDTDGDGVVKALATGSKMADAATGTKPITMIGSSVGDVYYVYSSESKIVEAANGGVDTVYAGRSYTLSNNVENLILQTGKAGATLTGNALGNIIAGGTNNDVLIGKGGDDLLILNGGADKIVYGVGDGNDTVIGFGSDDQIDLRGIGFSDIAALKSHLHTVGLDTVLDLGTGQSITFRNTTIDTFKDGSFLFDKSAPGVTGTGVDPYYRPTVSSNGTDTPAQSGASGGKATDASGSIPSDAKIGTAAADNIVGTKLNDYIVGNGGDDRLAGGDGHDKIFGGDGNDTLVGAKGDDILHGDAGNDTLRGDDGNDQLFGDAGNDRLTGGNGNDVLNGGLGSDTLTGGAGADMFVFSEKAAGDIDRITDFNTHEGDRLDLRAFLGTLDASASFNDYVRLVDKGSYVSVDIAQHGLSHGDIYDTALRISGATANDLKAAILWH